MKNVFNLAGQVLNAGILVNAQFSQGSCGRVDIFLFETLRLTEQEGKRIYITAAGGVNHWVGAQEPQDMSDEYRRLNPSNRGGTCYLPQGFGGLDIIDTSNGSRFLSLNRTWLVGEVSSSVDEEPEQEVGVVLRDMNELSAYLEELLPRLGVPQDNITEVKKDILAKLAAQ